MSKFTFEFVEPTTVLAIVGSRDFDALPRVIEFVSRLKPTTMVISGGARGVDAVAVEAAELRGLHTKVYPAEWEKHGRGAGMIRNSILVELADHVVAFWDGRSRGTFDTITKARKAGKLFAVYDEDGRKVA